MVEASISVPDRVRVGVAMTFSVASAFSSLPSSVLT
jgi:hypothetical protein